MLKNLVLFCGMEGLAILFSIRDAVENRSLYCTTDQKELWRIFPPTSDPIFKTGIVIGLHDQNKNYVKYRIKAIRFHLLSQYHKSPGLVGQVDGEYYPYCAQLFVYVEQLIK